MQPYLVREISDSEGNIVSEVEPTVVRQVISEETSAEVCKILEAVVGDSKEGTGKNAYVAGYRIGGKTGTSTDTTKEVDTGEKEYIVSFIGFAPAWDEPQIAIMCCSITPHRSQKRVSTSAAARWPAPTVGKGMMSDILPSIGLEAEYTETEIENMDKTVPALRIDVGTG